VTGGPVTVERGAWIGADTLALPDVTVARGCVIGAGTIVTKDTESGSVYAGIPARRIRDLA